MKTLSNLSRPVLARLAVVLAALALLVVAPGLVGAAHAAPKAAAAPAAGDGVVNLNTASEEELQLLPGVGASKASAIVAWRKKYGGLKKVDDLTKVKGFGHKSLKKLRPYLAVSGETTMKERPSKSRKGEAGDEQASAP
jgi:competence protein ComEA